MHRLKTQDVKKLSLPIIWFSVNFQDLDSLMSIFNSFTNSCTDKVWNMQQRCKTNTTDLVNVICL